MYKDMRANKRANWLCCVVAGAATNIAANKNNQKIYFQCLSLTRIRLDKLPKSQQAKAKSMLHEIFMAATRADEDIYTDVA